MRLVQTQAPPNVELVAVGGLLRELTQSFVGPHATRTIEGHFADHAFVSVKAVSQTGMLADVDVLEAEVKRTMIAQANQAVLLIDRSKLSARALNAIGPISDVSLVLAHGIDDNELRELEKFEVPVRSIGDLGATEARSPSAGKLTGVADRVD
jgi:DeoR/GlpR family transcriptional regulator of sugar metabolism